MMNPMEMSIAQKPRRQSMVMPALVGFGAFAVGAVLTFGYVQWKSQQQQMALMTQMVQQLQSPAAAQTVTRAASPDLLTVAPAPAPTPAAEVIPASAPAAAPAPAPQEELAVTTADRIRALVSRSSDPLVSAALAQDTARRETMSVAIQGVNELVDSAVAGNYALSTVESAGGGKRLRVTFEGHEEDQRELEYLLGSAASAGMIAFSDAVRSSDGTFDGQIILYDLVERALVNGSPDERRTGAEMHSKALELLGKNKPAVAVAATTTSGERFYTVEAGDSLAYIALQFYGNTNAYQRIFQANRGQLSSPEKIQIGQRLLIPEV